MTTSLDFILLPLVRKAGKDRPKMPGLYATAPPRRTARGRASDYLILHLALEGNAPLSSSGHSKLLESLAEAYFKTGGSSTAAMRRVAEGLNEYLLKRNMNAASRGLQGIGMLTLAVIRYEHIYFLQSGAGQVYLIRSEGVQHFHDPDDAGRGLGLSRAPSFCYHQSPLSPGDVLLISSHPPLSWNTTTLRTFHGSPLGDLHRRLIRRAGSELDAAMMLVREGEGKLQLLRPQPLREEGQAPRKQKQAARESAPPDPPKAAPRSESRPEEKAKPVRRESSQEKSLPQKVESVEEKASFGEIWKSKVAPVLLAVGGAIKHTGQRLTQMIGTLARRMLPDETMLSLPGSTMAFIAIAVPLIVVAVASVVYFQRGRGKYYEQYMTDARAAAEQAKQYEDPLQQRSAWHTVLDYIDAAAEYQATEKSELLRENARIALDTLDKVVRVSYQQANIEALSDKIEIKRIVSTRSGDVYLLDGQEGDVYRAVFTGEDYELDEAFQCGPMPGPLIVGELVDIAALSWPSFDGATLLGIDDAGNLLRCFPNGEKPLAFQLGAPKLGWSKLQAMATGAPERDKLYVMQPEHPMVEQRGVWMFDGSQEYREDPIFFFGDQVPSMQDVLDLTVADGRLYLLHADGHLTTSKINGEDYQDPAIYGDTRAGMEAGPTVERAAFSQLQYAPPPDPSVYFLDSDNLAIFQFSLQLAYQRQYRPQGISSEQPATAFAVSVAPDHKSFLAFGNQLYYALLP